MWKGGGEKKKRKGKKRDKKRKGMRCSNFSLEFSAIGPLVSVEARGRVLLRDESFAWVLESGVFSKLREVGVLLQLGLILV